MSTYTGPGTEEFNNAESSMIDVMSTACPTITTKLGSVIRELVVRPMSYLYAWLSGDVSNTMEQYRMSNLMTSMLTDNQAADDIASLFFIERKQGTSAKGMISLTISTGTLRLPAGFSFTVAGVTMRTEKTIIAMGSEYKDTDSVLYVPCAPTGTEGLYRANVPVVASVVGVHEIEAGEPVTVDTMTTAIKDAALVSPITGGSGTETDADMLARAMNSIASGGVGSYYGIVKKLSNAPVAVAGLSIVSGEDVYMKRGRNNAVNICTGGIVDCYVKTQSQASVEVIDKVVDNSKGAQSLSVDISDDTVAGLYSVMSVSVDGVPLSSWSVSFLSSDDSMDGDMARLGNKQLTRITFDAPEGVSSFLLSVAVSYMPGIAMLQGYINTDTNKFVGQDTMVKAAVPVSVGIACAVHSDTKLTDDVKAAVSDTICQYVNSIPVGTRVLNFSDLRDAVASAHPGIALRLPCSMSAHSLLTDGTTDSCYSTSGLLDISDPVGAWHWDSTVSFFSLLPKHVRLEEI